jgi:hypothetical protein
MWLRFFLCFLFTIVTHQCLAENKRKESIQLYVNVCVCLSLVRCRWWRDDEKKQEKYRRRKEENPLYRLRMMNKTSTTMRTDEEVVLVVLMWKRSIDAMMRMVKEQREAEEEEEKDSRYRTTAIMAKWQDKTSRMMEVERASEGRKVSIRSDQALSENYFNLVDATCDDLQTPSRITDSSHNRKHLLLIRRLSSPINIGKACHSQKNAPMN